MPENDATNTNSHPGQHFSTKPPRFTGILRGTLSMMLRGLGLIARFSLTIYMAKYLDLESVGAYGLIYATIAVVPAILDFGLHYHFTRDLIGQEIDKAALTVRDRIILKLSVVSVFLCITMALSKYGVIAHAQDPLLISFIIFAETLAFDFNHILLSLRRPVFANILTFVRTASWVIPFIIFGLLNPTLRNFHILLTFWACGLACTIAALIYGISDWPWRTIFSAKTNFYLFANYLRRSRLVYLSDFGILGAAYLDRFIVDFLLGLEETGVFTFYWSLANGVQLLVNVGVVQIAMPHLVDQARSSRPNALRHAVKGEVVKAAAVGAALSAITYGGVTAILPYVARPHLLEFPWLLPSLLVVAIFRVLSDVFQYGLYASGRDKEWAIVNLLAAFLACAGTYVGLRLFGLGGIGISMIGTEIILLRVRMHLLR